MKLSSDCGVILRNAPNIRGRSLPFLILILLAESAFSMKFTFVDVGTLTDGMTSYLYDSYSGDVNRNGKFVGYSYYDGGIGTSFRAVTYSESDGLVNLGARGLASFGNAINDNGDVIASGYGTGGFIYWNDTQQKEGLNYGTDINNKGEVVGRHQFDSEYFTPYVYRDGEMINLGTLGGIGGYAFGISDNSLITGSAGTAEGGSHAYLYDDINGMQDLGTLGGNVSNGYAVNNSGAVVGHSLYTSENSYYQAFLYSEAMGMVNLGTLGGDESRALSISDDGQIVGESEVSPGSSRTHGFYVGADGIMRDLNNLVIGLGEDDYIEAANGIALGERTYIAAYGWINGRHRGMLLTEAVPLPSAVWFLGSALGMLGWIRYRKV